MLAEFLGHNPVCLSLTASKDESESPPIMNLTLPPCSLSQVGDLTGSPGLASNSDSKGEKGAA
ncbi:hypothetical protein L484_005550 [Morus notabilis]|uniref:Uncharacterized protein n=1 Tax=Morus notabilis TaxID=981085 RepID=W9QQR0_9ROSA|nr:hypothetical protein L484_005550 [Morus notabilis]